VPRQATTSFARTFARIFAGLTVATFLVFALVGPVWLPAEQLTLKNPKGAINVGYVLNEGGDWFSILTTKNRNVIRIRSDNIDERVICDPRSKASRSVDLSIPQLVLHPGRNPLCPSVN
jgi:hypothetical protein